MSAAPMLVVPGIYREGVDAAHLGTHMSSIATPLGFTFCPYSADSVERWNFLSGCVQAYCGADAPIQGEQ